MQRKALIVPLTLGFLIPCRSVLASPVRAVYSSQARGVNSPLIQLRVGRGGGMNITFPEGENIKRVVLDDQSRIGLSFDGNLCQWTNQQQPDCKPEEAGWIHLRQLNQINFPNMPHSPDGGTLLTVRVQGINGRKTYLFQVIPVAGISEFANLDILPDSEKPVSLLPAPLPRQIPQSPTNTTQQSFIAPSDPIANTSSESTHPQLKESELDSNPVSNNTNTNTDSYLATSTKSPAQSVDDAKALAFGLIAAVQKGEIKPSTILWEQAQDTLMLLRQGASRTDAVHKAGLELSTFNQLLEWGQIFNFPQQQSPIVSNGIQSQTIETSISPTTSLQKSPPSTISSVNSSRVSSNKSSYNNSPKTQPSQPRLNLSNDANFVALGLILAKRKGQVTPNTDTWKQTQRLLILLRQGTSRADAVRETKLDPTIFDQLLELGQTRLREIT